MTNPSFSCHSFSALSLQPSLEFSPESRGLGDQALRGKSSWSRLGVNESIRSSRITFVLLQLSSRFAAGQRSVSSLKRRCGQRAS